MLCCRQGTKTKRTAAQAQFPLGLQSGSVHLLFEKKKTSACEICVPLFAGDYRLAHTPKSFVDCANNTLEVCSVTKHRNNEVQSAVTCELVE